MRVGWLRLHAWPVLPFLQHILPLRYTVVSSLLCFPPFSLCFPPNPMLSPLPCPQRKRPSSPKPTSTPYVSTTLLSSSTHHPTPSSLPSSAYSPPYLPPPTTQYPPSTIPQNHPHANPYHPPISTALFPICPTWLAPMNWSKFYPNHSNSIRYVQSLLSLTSIRSTRSTRSAQSIQPIQPIQPIKLSLQMLSLQMLGSRRLCVCMYGLPCLLCFALVVRFWE